MQRKDYYNSMEEYNHIPGTESEEEHKSSVLGHFGDEFAGTSTSRRDFLKVFGYSLTSAAILASCEKPVQKAIPYIIQPEEIISGKALHYATSYFDGNEFASIVVKTRDGRPIKVEGNELSPYNGKGTTARVQASVLSLYDDARLKSPAKAAHPITWAQADSEIKSALDSINRAGGKIVLLTPTILSPTTRRIIREFGDKFGNFSWVRYNAFSYSAIRQANQEIFGKDVIPDLKFAKAGIIVALNADFLGSWLAPVHFIPSYTKGRNPGNGPGEMVKHFQLESGMSLTGSNADIRIPIRPSQEKLILANIYNKIASREGKEVSEVPLCDIDLEEMVDDLLKNKGKSIVVSGTNDLDIQRIIIGINLLLGNYGECIDMDYPLNLSQGNDNEMETLAEEIKSSRIDALLVYDVNPAYDYYSPDTFIGQIKNLKLSVNISCEQNEMTGVCTYDLPAHHYLESWNDYEIIPGNLSLSQPCIHPIFDTRSFQDNLLNWMGKDELYSDYLKEKWKEQYFPYSKIEGFEAFWKGSLRDGVFGYKPDLEGQTIIHTEPLILALQNVDLPQKEGFEVVFYSSVALANGKHANNPWLMELPDPVGKFCWENVLCISPSDAETAGISTGDVIKLGDTLKVPAFVQPGQAAGTLSVALGYGHTRLGKVADHAGVNVYPLAGYKNGSRTYGYKIQTLSPTGEKVQLALTQTHHSMEGRAIVRETTLGEYVQNPASGNELHEEFESKHQTLYPDVNYDGFHWGMGIDLNSCIGCSACVIACQAENNIPVVGKSEVVKRRIMHWIRIDRYYTGSPQQPMVVYQPLMCQHCDNAPCENVCPVSATNHSSEGLNQMSYNRCIGTKYCINNCPYKVRRFNWFRYTGNKEFDFNAVSDLGKLVLNPDVTVRERGVVEKCTFCAQRIQEVKLAAKLDGRAIADGEVQPACVQSCPSGALVFGNMKDKDSRVSRMKADPRNYHLLEELHTLPSVGYLTKVRNT